MTLSLIKHIKKSSIMRSAFYSLPDLVAGVGFTRGIRPVPVLMYHHVNSHKGDANTVTHQVFEAQMEHLSKAGYRTLRIGELLDYLAGRVTIKERAVAVTFDDGWLDNYRYAFPVLKRYNIHACIFIVTGWVGDSGRKASLELPPPVPLHRESKALINNGCASDVILSWDHIEEMRDSGLVEFHAHTKSHPYCSALSRIELLDELNEPKRVIGERLGTDCPCLCWPYGDFNDAAVNEAKRIGYKALFTTVHGVASQGTDLFAVNRIYVYDNVDWFKTRLMLYTNPLLLRFWIAAGDIKSGVL